MMIVSGYPVFICWFSESIFLRREIYIFLLFKISSRFYSPKKSSNCFFIVYLLIVFCVGTEFKFLFKSLNVFVLDFSACGQLGFVSLVCSSVVLLPSLFLTTVLTANFGLYFKEANYLNLHCCNSFFVAVSLEVLVFLISL